MKIACFECDEREQALLREKCKDHDLVMYDHPLRVEDVHKITNVDALIVFIYSPITKEILQRLPFLKLVLTLSTGYDHIDLKACAAHGITVCNVPKYGGTAVAEHTFALLLALVRNIPKAVTRTEHDDFSLDGLCGAELAHKTLGVIGAGTIGSAVIKRACAFDMRVLVHERTPNKQLESYGHVQHVTLPKLLRESDIVTLHVPYTQETHHILNKKAFKQMKPGAFIINTARGGLIDTHALHEALLSKHIAGAALDVLEGECDLKEAHQVCKPHHSQGTNWKVLREAHRLLKMHNVIVTPHMAFYTHEAIHTIIDTTVQSINAFDSGQPINTIK